MFSHAGFDAGVVAQAGKETVGFVRIGEIGKREKGAECVGCFVLGFLPVAVSGRGGGLEGGGSLGGFGL